MKRLTIELPGEMVVPVSDLLLGLEAGAVSEEPEEQGKPLIHAYFREETDIEEIIRTVKEFSTLLDENADAARFSTRYVNQADWEGWKSYLKPVKASRRILITPPWEKPHPAERETKIVEINPGNAFGTGHHETTRICISYLDETIEKSPGCSVLDVGCGSGILAICSIKLGADISFCVDTDFNAARETFLNSARNGTSDKMKVWCGSVNCTQKKFDVIVSNTSKEVLISMKDILRERLLPMGHLIVSGIQATEKQEVARIYKNSGYNMVSGKIEGEWAGLLFRSETTRKPTE